MRLIQHMLIFQQQYYITLIFLCQVKDVEISTAVDLLNNFILIERCE